MAEVASSLRAEGVVSELKKCGVTHVVWLPDTESKYMYDAVQRAPGIDLVPICREGEGPAICLGLMMGGKTPILLIQNTGFFESGDAIRGICLDLALPLLIMIGYRGYEPSGKPMVDSAGAFTEPMLKTWGIPYYLVDDDFHTPRIGQAFKEAKDTSHPVAILIGREYQ